MTGSTDGEPWCFAPKQQGYAVTSVLDTALGFQLQLRRIDTPSWFGGDFATVQLDVEFQTDDRLRLKVGGGGTLQSSCSCLCCLSCSKDVTKQYEIKCLV